MSVMKSFLSFLKTRRMKFKKIYSKKDEEKEEKAIVGNTVSYIINGF